VLPGHAVLKLEMANYVIWQTIATEVFTPGLVDVPIVTKILQPTHHSLQDISASGRKCSPRPS
jgi:hypothetical protein